MPSYRQRALEFVGSTDFHGLRHIVNGELYTTRRVIYTVVFAASVIVYSWYAIGRLHYYLSYPYATATTITHGRIPIPAMGICPPDRQTIFYRTPEELVNEDDVNLIYYLREYHKYNNNPASLGYFPLEFNDDRTDLVYTDAARQLAIQKLEDYIFDRNMAPNDTVMLLPSIEEKTNELPIQPPLQVPTTRGKRQLQPLDYYQFLVERLRSMPPNMTVRYHETFKYFMEKMGVTFDFVLSCIITLNRDIKTEDCTADARGVLTDRGHCLILDSYNNSEMLFLFYDPDQRNHVTIEVDSYVWERRFPWKPSIIFFERSSLPNSLYGSITYGLPLSRYSTIVTMTRRYESTVLDHPYHDYTCSHQERSHCFENCLQTSLNCTPYFFNSLSVARQDGNDLKEVERQCPPLAEYVDRHKLYKSAEFDNCKNMCPNACKEKGFSIEIAKEVREEGLFSKFAFKTYRSLPYERYIEAPLYEFPSLMAELGGTLSLFVGASAITLFHFMEFMWLISKDYVENSISGRCRSGRVAANENGSEPEIAFENVDGYEIQLPKAAD